MIFTNMKLSDLCVEISYGYTASATENNTGCKFLRITDIQGGYVDWDKVPFCEIESKDITKYQLIEGDIVIARTGNSTGENFIFQGKNNAVFASYLIRYRVNKEIANPYYIWLNLRSSNWWGFVSGAKSGSAQAGANAKILGTFEIPIPDLQTQNKIADFFQHINNKIQLNTQINQTLEQIAQALFKSWFVDFDPVRAKVQALSNGLSLEQAELAAMQAISGKTPEELTALSQTQPERYAELAETAKAFPCEMVEVDGFEVPKGWEVKPLPEIIDFLEGPGIRNWQYTDEEDGIKFINIRCIQNGDLTLTTANKITKEEAFGKYKHFQLEEDDIVVSTSGTLGRFAFVRKEHLPLSLNTSVIRFRPIKNKSTLGFIAGFVENQLQHELEIRASGSAQRNFGPTHLKQISLLVPDFKLLELHQKYASSLFEKRKQLLSEIDVLKDTRDLLLPKLLNGEI
ncbi:restriction endonuclease subunit S [Haemophilus sp. SZY H51]|uniref:restriction endonuclease subunit S n=1 Tax=Haemophilus sp. SZY H51 TaxID=3041427 RepID=UPI0025AFDEF6|nr:restriction endonuclease subunit S [Haemophilus sp. SZY H51]MDN3211263.1 restriction endonuclease subunit S [Haemophilus sp. SZY H51]